MTALHSQALEPGAGSPAAATAVIVGAFAGARAWAWASGLRFDASEAARFWHFIEPALLANRLGESLLHLHAQPPLFNAWLGLYDKIFGEGMAVAFGLSYLALGVVLCVKMLAMARALDVPVWPRTIGVAIVCTSPSVLLYEHFLLYAYPVAVLLTWSAASLHRALEQGRGRDWWVFAGLVAAVVLMRALYHPVWLLLVLAGAVWASWRVHGSGRKVLAPALAALLVVGAVLAKNHALFGQATLSSFSGMNLSRVVLDRMDADERADWVARGVLSPWAATGAFKPLPDYVPAPPATRTGVALLDRPFKADGSVNFHHQAYLRISDQLRQDSLAVIRQRPGVYLSSVGQNLMRTLHPASTYAPLAAARERIAPLVAVYEPVLGWPPWLGATGVWIVLLPAILIATGVSIWRGRGAVGPRWVLTAYLAGCIVYVVAVGALMERTENMRFRFDVEPMIWLLLLAALQEAWRAARARWWPAPPPDADLW